MTQVRSEETRARILQAAGTLFSRAGYDAAGVADICEAAGVSKGAFYHHFETKQALFLALMENWLAELDRGFLSVLTMNQNVPEMMVEIGGLTEQVFEISKGKVPLYLEFWMQASRQPEIWKQMVAPYHRYEEMFTQILQRGINEGSINPTVKAQPAAQILVAMAMGMLLQALFDPEASEWGKTTQEGVRMMMDGIARRSL